MTFVVLTALIAISAGWFFLSQFRAVPVTQPAGEVTAEITN